MKHIVKYFFEIQRQKRSLKKMSLVIQNGTYFIQDKTFCLKNDISSQSFFLKLFRVKIHSKEKVDKSVSSGIFFETPYKRAIVSKDNAFYFIKDKSRYCTIKNKVTSYQNLLGYKTMKMCFDDAHRLITSDHVVGNIHRDEEHFWLFLDKYFNSYTHIKKRCVEIDMNGKKSPVWYCPQHGDCHPGNIFWKNDDFTLIDLDDIDDYPLFYDVFYYALSFYHQDAFSIFKSSKFDSFVEKFVSKTRIDCEDVIDYYLASYLYFWVNQMNKNTKFFDINFYVRWFDGADLSCFKLTEEAFDKYKKNIRMFNIRK